MFDVGQVRGADLIPTNPTKRDFIYQTPVTGFSAIVVPFIYGAAPIDSKSTQTTTLAAGLGEFFQTLMTSDPASQCAGRLQLWLSDGGRSNGFGERAEFESGSRCACAGSIHAIAVFRP